MKKVKVGIVGGSGYTGIELLRLLAQHPHAEIVTITGRKDAGTHVAKMFPSLRGRVDLVFEDPASAPLDQCDVVFFATPHGVATVWATSLWTCPAAGRATSPVASRSLTSPPTSV